MTDPAPLHPRAHNWDQRYATDGFLYGREPNTFLVRQASAHLRPGMAVLCIGDGEGRNGVWLAGQGLRVTAVDYSRVGLDKARRFADERGVAIDFIEADLAHWQWPHAMFDAAVNIFVHVPPVDRITIHRGLWQCLKPGGLLIAQMFHKDQLRFTSGGPKSIDWLYDAALVRADFPAAEALHLSETEETLQEPPLHVGDAALVSAVLRKPRG